jgi:hypothetical protein
VEAITDFLKYLPRMMADYWPLSIIPVVFCLSVLVGILYIVGHVLFYILDLSFRPRLQCSGQIRQKTYTPETTTTTTGGTYSGLDFITVTTSHTVPASYALLVETNAGYAWKSVDSAFYNSVSTGSSINVRYSTGRFSNTVYIRRLSG